MARRRVKTTEKSNSGEILALCNSLSTWRKVNKSDAIDHIDQNKHRYYVRHNMKEVDVHVVPKNPKPGEERHLRTDWDDTEKNNLEDLPDC